MSKKQLEPNTEVLFLPMPGEDEKELRFKTPQPLSRAWELRQQYGFGRIFLKDGWVELTVDEIAEAMSRSDKPSD